jgi:cell division septation protein DedD
MARKEDGEYELVLGNRQLLTIFFLVVVLLGAGFTVGYIMGRNSVSVPVNAADSSTAKSSDPDVKLDPPAPVPASSEPSAKPATPAPEESPAPAPPPKSTTPQKSAGETAATPYKFGPPPAGSVFVQVSATSKGDAQIEAATLSKQGFPVWIAPNDKNPELFSVLVGPYPDKADLAKAKSSLENLGFRKAFRKEFK